MTTNKNNQALTTDNERQRDYVNGLKSKGETSYSLVAAQAFVEGMRDSGFGPTTDSISSLIDNSFDAVPLEDEVIAARPGNNN